MTRLADVIWAVQMSTVEFHPWNSRRADTERPDEWRIDLDPMPNAASTRFAGPLHDPRDPRGARRRGLAEDVGWLWPARLRAHRARWGFKDVRRGALAFAREVERRLPDDVTTTWWRRDRSPEDLFVDYNQNARDHTIAAAYSVRGNPRGTVSAPLAWDEIADAEPQDFTIATMPERFSRLGDLHAGIDDAVFDFATLLEWADRDEREGKDVPPEPDSRPQGIPWAGPAHASPPRRHA